MMIPPDNPLLAAKPRENAWENTLRNALWARRRDIPLAILAWIALIAVLLWTASYIARSLLILTLAALLAYALAPAVKFLERVIPRAVAILLVYLLFLAMASGLLYLVISTTIMQVILLSHDVQRLLTPGAQGQANPLTQTLLSLGISQSQLDSAREQLLARIEGIASSVVPLLKNIFSLVLDTVVVAVISIYFLLDGSRVTRWLRSNMPRQQQNRVGFFLDTVERIVGGYIRGQVILALLIGVLVGVGMLVFQVPYAVLLGVLAFVFAFIPVIGTFISGALCIGLALTKGPFLALGVLVYFIIMHVIEGDVVGPRIVGKAIGLHPIVSLAALLAGAELFGIWGALFASPVAGVFQALLVSFWTEWRQTHVEQFPLQAKMEQMIEEHLPEKPGEIPGKR